ncbi:MAG: tRNA (adenosine(37)-N6)-dimethylallyltransferase MiaA [Paraprevotella sp.]|nr:tRNA (adenosine(37)-N6)-dimethylallyltransferase MiaA [Paraprevotella sp.]
MKHLIVLTGPTGVGKTELSLSVAEFLHSPVINADSRQLYAELPIGTAAPTPAQQARVEHRFVGTLKLTDYYSAARYEEDVMKTLDELYQQQDYALLSGGSMMYIDAVCKGIDDIPTVDEETRRIMLERYQAEGLTPLANELRLLDPTYYNEADIRNPKRVIHALEICYMTGKPYSSFRMHQTKKRPFHIIKIGLQRDREELYRRINDRVENMVSDGLVEEALKVQEYRTVNALNTVGYKEIFKYIDGEWTLDYAKEKIKQNTRIYSRKQMTWFRRDADMTWFQPEQTEDILNFIAKSIR